MMKLAIKVHPPKLSKTNMEPQKITQLKRKIIFQSSILGFKMLIFQGVYRSEFVDGDGHSQVGWIYFFSGP